MQSDYFSNFSFDFPSGFLFKKKSQHGWGGKEEGQVVWHTMRNFFGDFMEIVTLFSKLSHFAHLLHAMGLWMLAFTFIAIYLFIFFLSVSSRFYTIKYPCIFHLHLNTRAFCSYNEISSKFEIQCKIEINAIPPAWYMLHPVLTRSIVFLANYRWFVHIVSIPHTFQCNLSA